MSKFTCKNSTKNKPKDPIMFCFFFFFLLPSCLKEKLKLLYQDKINILDAQVQSLR